jgi:FixJ family two-component response regulator
MAEPQPTVFVVDDDASMRRALSHLLMAAGYNVETYSSAETFLTRDNYEGVGCVILDVRMPGLSGMELQEKLTGSAHNMPIIFLTGHGEVAMGVEAMKKGAVDFLTKPCDDEQLLAAINNSIGKALQARAHFEEVREIQRRIELLTPREKEILPYIITGMLNKQIAAKLGIAEPTLKIHRGRIMEKLSAESVADLVRLAGKIGMKPSEK